MNENLDGNGTTPSARRSAIWQRYTRLLHEHMAQPGSEAGLVAQCWLEVTGQALSDFPARLASHSVDEVTQDVLECLNNIVAGLPAGATLATESQAGLLVQMALVTVDRWLNDKADLSQWTQDGVATLPLLEDALAAMVAASCLGLNLSLGLRPNSAGGLELQVSNLVTDIPELEAGVVDAPTAIGHAVLGRVLPSVEREALSALPSDDLLFSHVARHARRTGARLIVGLGGRHQASASQAAKRWAVGVFVRHEPPQSGPDQASHPLLALKSDIETQLSAVRAVLAARAPAPGRAAAAAIRQQAVTSDPLVFISYAHEDLAMRNEFEVHLKTYVVNAGLRLWTDDLIEPGKFWHQGIVDGIQRCTVAVLLLSPQCMASEFIMKNELPWLRERHDRGEIAIVPIHMERCSPAANAWLAASKIKPGIDEAVPPAAKKQDRNTTLLALAKIVNDLATPTQAPRTTL